MRYGDTESQSPTCVDKPILSPESLDKEQGDLMALPVTRQTILMYSEHQNDYRRISTHA